MDEMSAVARLMATIEERKRNPSTRSYTSQLLVGGVPAIGAKVLEEGREIVEAAAIDDDVPREAAMIHEAADLLYHLLVLLAFREVTWTQVEVELARRFGISGLDEKAARQPKN